MSCSGTNAYRYGTIKEWVLSMTVVLADGTVVKTHRRPRKTSAGFDLTHLIIGSEGTLGLVTEAVLKVTIEPQNLQVAIVTFSDVRIAVKTALAIIKASAGSPIDALELLDSYSMFAINKTGFSSVQWKEVPTLFLKFAGSQTKVKDQIDMATAAAKQHGSDSFVLYSGREEIKAAWDARKVVAKAVMATKEHPSHHFLSADAAVPMSRLGDIMNETQRMIKEAGFVGSTLGHVGDGTSSLPPSLFAKPIHIISISSTSHSTFPTTPFHFHLLKLHQYVKPRTSDPSMLKPNSLTHPPNAKQATSTL